MITYENIQEVVNMITPKDRKRMQNTSKEYIVLYLSYSNCCAWVTITLTNDFNRYKNVANNGNCILELEDAIFDHIIER